MARSCKRVNITSSSVNFWEFLD